MKQSDLDRRFWPYVLEYRRLANTITKASAAERIVEILDTRSDIVDAPDALDIPKIDGRIEFESVYFAYDPAHPLLSDVAMHVEPGEKVAIVGSTGVRSWGSAG